MTNLPALTSPFLPARTSAQVARIASKAEIQLHLVEAQRRVEVAKTLALADVVSVTQAAIGGLLIQEQAMQVPGTPIDPRMHASTYDLARAMVRRANQAGDNLR